MPGFLIRHCNVCTKMIYLKEDSPGFWKPYESWVAGTVDEGQWVLHRCSRVVDPPVGAPPGASAMNASPASSPASVNPNSTQTIGQMCDRLMFAGMTLEASLDLMAKVAHVLEVMASHGLSPLDEVEAMYSCYNAQFEFIEVMRAEESNDSVAWDYEVDAAGGSES